MSFFGIRLAGRALLAHQHAIDITGQNIANVNTPGYSRQTAIRRAVPGAAPAIGGGVEIARVQREHAAWLERTMASLRAQAGATTIDQRLAAQVEALLAEPTDAGLQAAIHRFFTAWGSLIGRADDPAARAAVLPAGGELALHLRRLTEGLDALAAEAAHQATDSAATVNDLARQIADLNRALRHARAAGAPANELLDQREQLVAELTRLTGAVASGEANGEHVVSLGGRALVQGDVPLTVVLAKDGSLNLTTENGEVVPLPGGELRALQEWATGTLPAYRERIARMRDQLAEAVNALHRSGRDRDGRPGEAFFVADAGGNLSVNPTLGENPRRLVTGDGAPGDGSVALRISQLRAEEGAPLSEYPSLVADVGRRAADSRRAAESQRLGLQQMARMQAAESGVNLDEELAEMVTLQHAYAASARLLAAYDEMLTTLIERTGR